MNETDDVRFACIGCGTFNLASAESCGGCGHRFAGPDVLLPALVVLPPGPVEFYLPPATPIRVPRTFQIGSLFLWIAVIAVCLAAFHQEIGLGILATISLVPAALWTWLLVEKRRSVGLRTDLVMRILWFLTSSIYTWVILFTSMIPAIFVGYLVVLLSESPLVFIPAVFLVYIICVVWLARVCTKGIMDGIT